jgi:kynureninase
MSNPSALAVVSLLGSLQVYDLTSMDALRAKSLRLTALLELLLATRIQQQYAHTCRALEGVRVLAHKLVGAWPGRGGRGCLRC